MKNFVLALIVAALMAVQVFTPVSAAACGDTYTVKRGDSLSKIAKACEVSLNTLIKANPEIKDINKIFTGQVIRIKNDTTIPVSGGTYVVAKGDTLQKIAARFNTTVAELMRLNPNIKEASKIYVGQVIKLPAGTTNNPTTPTTGRRVTLSVTSAKPGGQVVVTAAGFPANQNVDIRLGKDGREPSVFVDAKTDANGAVSATLTIPTSAVAGEKWFVKVLTTDIARGVEANSSLITITN